MRRKQPEMESTSRLQRTLSRSSKWNYFNRRMIFSVRTGWRRSLHPSAALSKIVRSSHRLWHINVLLVLQGQSPC